MRKSFILFASLLVIGVLSGNSQMPTKEAPSSPPPKVNLKKVAAPIVTAEGKMADDFYKRNIDHRNTETRECYYIKEEERYYRKI